MRGGKRPGSGRKAGSVTKRTREIAERATAEGISPLEVMLEAMRDAYTKGSLEAAAKHAKEAAPYCHARFASVEHSGANGGPIQIIASSDDLAL